MSSPESPQLEGLHEQIDPGRKNIKLHRGSRGLSDTAKYLLPSYSPLSSNSPNLSYHTGELSARKSMDKIAGDLRIMPGGGEGTDAFMPDAAPLSALRVKQEQAIVRNGR